eukprot:171284_1
MTKKKQFQMGTTHTVESVVCDENIYTVRQPHMFRDVDKVLQNKYDLERKVKEFLEDIGINIVNQIQSQNLMSIRRLNMMIQRWILRINVRWKQTLFVIIKGKSCFEKTKNYK